MNFKPQPNRPDQMNLSPEDIDLAITALTAAKANPQQEFEYQHIRGTATKHWFPAAPTWDFGVYRYRLKLTPPAPTVTPWTFADAPLTMKVRRKSDGALFRMEARPRGALLFDDGIPDEVAYLVLRTDFEQLDSSPCGVVEGGAK